MFLYRFLLTLLSPLFALFLLRQVLRKRERLADLSQRFGYDLRSRPASQAPVLWVHGASNGELTAARAMIEEALRRAPGLEVVVTVNTVSARRMVRKWQMHRLTVRLAPMDLRPTLNRFLDTIRPAALVSLENEIWPNRFALLAKRDIPIIVAGARMSEKSARRWDQMQPIFGGVLRRTIAAITRLAAQDTASEQRLLQMGLPADALLPRMNLKSSVTIEDAPAETLDGLSRDFIRASTILAASTHAGEEQIICEAFRILRQAHPEARLILAPRHPARAVTVANELRSAGLQFAQRSKGEPAGTAPVYLADTLGEMPLWYRLSGITFMGGSLVERGGHTPYEPVQFETTILHGPYVSNHIAAYHALDTAKAAEEVSDPETLAKALSRLLSDPLLIEERAEAAHRALTPLREAQMRQEAFWAALADLPNLQALG